MAKQFSHPPVTLQDGMILAVQMLQELESEDSDDCSIFPEYRTDSEVAQRNVVMEYLDKIQTPEAREGFTRVLSDFVACSVCSGVPDASSYERIREGARK